MEFTGTIKEKGESLLDTVKTITELGVGEVLERPHGPEDAEVLLAPLQHTEHAGIACVGQLSEDDHILLLTMHHIVSDGWSIGVLVRELA